MRGSARLVAAAFVIAATALVGVVAAPSATADTGRVAGVSQAPALDPCGVAPTLTAPVCRVVGGVVTGGVHALTGAAGAVVGGVADGVLGSVSAAMGQGAAWFVGKIAGLVTASTSITVTSDWFGTHYRVMVWIAAAFAVAFLLLTAASSLLHQDATRMLRAVAMTAAAGVGAGAAVTIVQALLVVTDSLCRTVTGSARHDLAGALTGASRIAGISGLGIPGSAPVMVTLLAGAAAIVAGLLLWIELLLREAAVYAALLFFPLALAGLAWEPSRRWARRLAETLAALIFSKFVIAAVLALAVSGLGHGDGATAVLSGAGLLWVAALAPFLLMRIIGVLEVGMAASHLEGVRSRGTHTGVYYGQTASYALSRRGSGGAMPLAAAGAGAPYAAAGWAASGAARGLGSAADRAGRGPAAAGGAQ